MKRTKLTTKIYLPKTNMFMKYEEMIDCLLKKYGPVKGDYFLDEECKYPNTSIKRGKDNLYIHHIFENKAILLSKQKQALMHPFEYQKAENLVYCDLYEHLQLHMILTLSKQKPNNQSEILGLGGVINYIVPELIDHWAKWNYIKQPWKNKESEYLDKYFYCFTYEFPLFVSELLFTKDKRIINFFKKIYDSRGGQKVPRAFFIRSMILQWMHMKKIPINTAPKEFLNKVVHIISEISIVVQSLIRNKQKHKIKPCEYVDIDSWCISNKF